MSDTHDDYYNLAKRIEDAFAEIDSDISTDLFHTDEEYAALRREADKLQQEYPLIEKVMQGEGTISLTADEHAALARYLDVKIQLENTERQQIYFRGHTRIASLI